MCRWKAAIDTVGYILKEMYYSLSLEIYIFITHVLLPWQLLILQSTIAQIIRRMKEDWRSIVGQQSNNVPAHNVNFSKVYNRKINLNVAGNWVLNKKAVFRNSDMIVRYFLPKSWRLKSDHGTNQGKKRASVWKTPFLQLWGPWMDKDFKQNLLELSAGGNWRNTWHCLELISKARIHPVLARICGRFWSKACNGAVFHGLAG